MVLIVTSFGATKNYPDPEMMRQTLAAFLGSLDAQTDKSFRLFVSCHDHPGPEFNRPWAEWHSIAVPGDDTFDKARIPVHFPSSAGEEVEYRVACSDGKLTDMGRKTFNSVIEAGRWAHRNGLREFWMLRMDSDDLLWRAMVEYLHLLQEPFRAVYNRKCHMIDYRLREMAVHDFPASTTVNALRYRLTVSGVFDLDWYYHCRDHTTFARTVREDNIPYLEKDFTLCIVTNSGNSISGRPEIDKEKNVQKIAITPALAERYGLDAYLSRA